MNNLIEQLNKAKQQISLDADRKAAMRARLLEVMDAPVRADAALRHRSRGRSISSPINQFFTPMKATLAAIVGAVLVGTAGVSFAASNARPGDALYGVKVGFNEPIRAAFAFNGQAKAQVAIDRAQARLDEASSLSSEGRLNGSTEAELRAAFEQQADVAEDNMNKLHDDGNVQAAADLAGRFEGTLRAEQAILASLDHGNVSTNGDLTGNASSSVEGRGNATSSANANVTASLGASIRGRLNALENLRAHLESDTEGDVSASANASSSASLEAAARAQVRVALSVAASAQAFVTANTSASTSVSVAAQAKAAAAQQLAAQAQAELNAGAFAKAFTDANAAIRASAEARALISSQDRFEGSGSNNVFRGILDNDLNGDLNSNLHGNANGNGSSDVSGSGSSDVNEKSNSSLSGTVSNTVDGANSVSGSGSGSENGGLHLGL